MYAFCGIDAVWLLVDARQMFSSRTHTGLAYVFVAVSGEDKARTLLPCFVKKGIRFIQLFKLCCFGIVEYVFQFYPVSASHLVEIEFLSTVCYYYYAFAVLRDSEI